MTLDFRQTFLNDVAQMLLDFGRQFRTLHVVFGPELVVTHNRFVETRSVVLPYLANSESLASLGMTAVASGSLRGGSPKYGQAFDVGAGAPTP
jgi:hypothetical protein